jgi:hypothetical protein
MKILDVPQSGSLAGITSSRNRFGQYRRTRAIPVNPNTPFQGQQRTRFGALTALWSGLTDAQRAGWADLALSITRTDSLGQSYTMSGAECYMSINLNNLDAGNAVVSDAPAKISAVGLLTATITTTGGTLSVAYTATPLPTGARLFIYASPQRSPGRNFENDLRLVLVSAAAAASPANVLAGYTARFGIPVVGNKIFFSFQVYLSGFMSGPMLASKLVTA